jgi:hypothetical protein
VAQQDFGLSVEGNRESHLGLTWPLPRRPICPSFPP